MVFGMVSHIFDLHVSRNYKITKEIGHKLQALIASNKIKNVSGFYMSCLKNSKYMCPN